MFLFSTDDKQFAVNTKFVSRIFKTKNVTVEDNTPIYKITFVFDDEWRDWNYKTKEERDSEYVVIKKKLEGI